MASGQIEVISQSHLLIQSPMNDYSDDSDEEGMPTPVDDMGIINKYGLNNTQRTYEGMKPLICTVILALAMPSVFAQ